jgi:hypothetical protein
MSNLNRWERWYVNMDEPSPYGNTITYALAADFLKDCAVVEDWGCGKGWFRTLRPHGYIGIDGTISPFADKHVDFTRYISTADGVLLRHVLEHNYEWQSILDNAVETAQKKICVVLFTPLVEETKEIAFNDDVGVPDISFKLTDILDRLYGFLDVRIDELQTKTQYEVETVIYGIKP